MAVKNQFETQPQIEQEKVLMSWVAKSRPFRKPDFQSRQVLIVLGVLIAMILVFAGEWMLLAVMAAGVFYYYATNFVPPSDMEYQITNLGIRAFGRLFGWWEFSRWWWGERYGSKLIGLEVQTGVMGRLYVPIGEQKPEEVEKLMNQFVFFEKPKDTTSDKMGKWLKEKFPLQSKI